jgi:hypothetical protein
VPSPRRALLAPKPLGFGDRYSLQTHALQRLLHLVEFERLDRYGRGDFYRGEQGAKVPCTAGRRSCLSRCERHVGWARAIKHRHHRGSLPR